MENNYHNYTNKKYYHTNEYDNLIKNELNIDGYIFLSNYIVFQPCSKRKFIIKKLLFKNIKFHNSLEIPDNYTTKNFKELYKIYSTEYSKFKNKYNTDIYPYIFNNISNDIILECIKYCCKHDFLPNILSETDNFLEIEYLDSSVWRPSTPFERTTNKYFKTVNSYCSHVKNLDLCVTTIDCQNHNIMVNIKTLEFKIIDIEEVRPITHFVPGLCWWSDEIFANYECWVLRTDYRWSCEFFNKSFEYYKDLLKLVLMRQIYILDMQIMFSNDYKNLPRKL